MIASYSQATDQLFNQINVKWKEALSIVGYVPDIYWQGIEKSNKPDPSKFWIRVSRQTVREEQSAFGNSIGGQSQRRYTADGLIFVQLFCPKDKDENLALGRKLAELAKSAFRGKTTEGNIWFKNTRINELPPESEWNRFNIVTEFNYDELG